MWKQFINIFKRNEKKILLGRWGNYGNDIKNIYANHDNCGDIICKDPIIIKTFIENKNINKNKNKLN
tara:strand:+ start:285 stop:485 length:201 start_codon:yes stop_codon:yes gene_type:complete